MASFYECPAAYDRGDTSLSCAATKMTGAFWRSGFVAAVFAIHPLRVESVAWIAERKDVLSGVFFMLTLLAYAHYTRLPSLRRYLLVVFVLACGLMSKPMLVTLPFVLLLLDYWPLDRIRGQLWKRVLEKLPLVALSAISSIATLVAQKGAVGWTEDLPILERINNAVVSYVLYIWQMFWPVQLAVFYPHPENALPLWEIISSVLLLICITAVAIALRKQRPYLITGWLWYLGMLVPVIGLVQVGWQGRADRYTYLPQIGLYIAVAWAVADLTASWRRQRAILSVAALLVIGRFELVRRWFRHRIGAIAKHCLSMPLQ